VTNADCVLVGKIYTMDGSRPEVDGVAIRDGRISYVGDAREARHSVGPHAEVIELGDRVGLPGFIESHSHPMFYGRFLEEVDCRGCSSIGEITEALRARASGTPPGEWVLAHTYDDTLLKEQRHPDRFDLDRATDRHPIVLRHISAHSLVVNTEALRRAGIGSGTPDPEGGRIGRNAHGEPDGRLWEWAQGLVQSCLPEPSVEDMHRYLQNSAREYLAAGVTSVVDAALGFAYGMHEAEAWALLDADVRVPLRLGTAVLYPLWKELREGAGPGLDWSGDPEWVRPLAVKLFQDGSIQLRTAALRQPYHGETEPANGHLIWPQEELDLMVADAHSSGWQIGIHGNGDAAIGSNLDAYERALRDDPRSDHRHRIEHCQTAGEDQLDRMASLGVAASFFAPHVWYWGDRHRDIFLGPERAARIDPLASALQRGIRFGLHNDSPVTPISPLLSIGTAVSRLTSGGQVLGAGQVITLDQALRAMTLDSAYLAFEENLKGTLTEGKLGDVVVLEADPYEVPPQEIKDISVSATIVGGQIMYGPE
jgi:predicted amidohydrolase YtcJ